jgi:hypothetical protein
VTVTTSQITLSGLPVQELWWRVRAELCGRVRAAVTLSVTNGRDGIWSGACSSGGNKDEDVHVQT